jgi:esterase/lipase
MPSSSRPARRWPVFLGIILGGLLLVALAGPRTRVVVPDLAAAAGEVPTDLHALASWLAQREQAAGVTDSFVAARVRFAGDTTRTAYSVVYLHGFSGTHLESAPLSEGVAEALGANLYEARLRGHGLPGDSLATASAGDWIADAVRALAIGARLGDSVIVIGLSTGGTLATWLEAQGKAVAALHSVVLISPNFGARDPLTKYLLWPWANRLLPRLMPEIVLEDGPPANEEIARMGTGRFPSAAVFPMQALVTHVLALPLEDYAAPTLALYNPGDPVVDIDAIVGWLDRLTGSGVGVERELVTPMDGEHPHVLAGRWLAPTQVMPLTGRIVAFVRRSSP